MRIRATYRQDLACGRLTENIVRVFSEVGPQGEIRGCGSWAKAIRVTLALWRHLGWDREIPQQRWDSWMKSMEDWRLEEGREFPDPDSPGYPLITWWEEPGCEHPWAKPKEVPCDNPKATATSE